MKAEGIATDIILSM